VPITQKGQTFGKKCRAKLEGITGIRNQGSRQQLCLRKERATGSGIRGWSRVQEPCLGNRTTLNKTTRKTIELEIAKQIVRTLLDCRK
jgi:hypothetical protein